MHQGIYPVHAARELDHQWISQGMPSHSLMETAVLLMSQYLHFHFQECSFIVLCGPGNNGGDGYGIARWLDKWGHKVSTTAIYPARTEDCLRNFKLMSSNIEHISFSQCVERAFSLPTQTVVIDAILGTGQRSPDQNLLGILAKLRAVSQCTRFVCIDMPTGLNPVTGEWSLPEPPQVSLTLSLGVPKLPLYLSRRPGEVVEINIGLPTEESSAPYLHLQPSVLESLAKPHRPDDNKWSRGRVGVFANQGASILAANAAFATGAGLVCVINEQLHPAAATETQHRKPAESNAEYFDAILIGPAFGQDDQCQADFWRLWETYEGPMVVDADALHILSTDPSRPAGGPRILTPHEQEERALLGHSTATVNRIDRLKELRLLGHWVISKAATTVIIPPCSKSSGWISTSGSPHLGTGGSGDVLAGLVAGLCARLDNLEHAIILGVGAHAGAGERLTFGARAGSIIPAAREILSEWIDSNQTP